MRTVLGVFLLFLATASSATPLITSVTPNSGPVAGGTQVTIKGSGFDDVCAPPRACPVKSLNVYFGGDLAASSTAVDAQTVTAVTPPHLPGSVAVKISQLDGSVSLAQAFTFQGEPDDSFTRLLFPIFLPPTGGAFGARFVTVATVWNKFDVPDIPLYGILRSCPPVVCGQPDPMTPVPVTHNIATSLEPIGGNPGRILFVPKDSGIGIAANLRVYDMTRAPQNAGTEIPVVRESGFHSDPIALLAVPWHVNFRNTLRIYSAYPDAVLVRVKLGDTPERVVQLTPGLSIFEPAFAVITDFPPPPLIPGAEGIVPTMAILVEVPQPPPSVVGHANRIWAFVSSTNNVTQQITVVTPQ